MNSLGVAQEHATDAAIEREKAKLTAYLEACWAKNPVLSHLARGQSKPRKLPTIDAIKQGSPKQQSSTLYQGCGSPILNLEPTRSTEKSTSRIQKPSLATRKHVRDEKSLKQLAKIASQTGKEKKQAARGLSPTVCLKSEPLRSQYSQAKDAYDLGRKRPQLDPEEFPYAGDTDPVIKASALPQNFGVGRHGKSGHGTFPSD